MTKPESIAVIGVGCRYPGASGMDALWELMRDGRDVLGPAPEGRYTGLGESEMGRRLRGLRGGFLDGIDLFDPGAFNISPREARVMDPQQRLLLETAWEALEDAGQDMRALAGKPAGVFVGVWGSDYQTRLFRAAPGIDIATTTGGGRYAAAGRLSYAFDFRGPSLTIDTACSSSLVSIHMACQALRTGECGLAIAGGVNVILDPSVTIGYLTSGALSPGGACKFGDASADGYARSEGVGLVVLKLLSAAIADQDRIHAIIRGSAVTHSGQTGDSLLAPGEEAQAELIERALAMAGIGAAELDYIEAHGTGTRVGDRVELRALGKVLRAGGRQAEAPCLIGSIKTNIGHTESAAGAAGLIKAILCLKHREVPASLHFKEPNPEIPWSELPLRVVTRQTPMRSGSGPAYAGVNSFGITGTFAHIILEGAPAAATRASTGEQPVIVPVSARSSGALARLAGEYAKRIRASPGGLADIAYSAALRRTHHEWRFAAAGRDAETISAELTAFAGDGVGGAKTRPKVAWVFSGQGPQWAGMGMRLFQTEPVFRAALERLDGLIAAESGWSLLEVLQATGDASRLHLTACAQPAIFAIQIGLAELLQAWGLRPDMVVGHSVGEAAAACVAGVISLQDAVKIICARGRLMEEAAGLGKMAAVELTVEEAREIMAGCGGGLSLAAINAPRSLTISGPEARLKEFCNRAAALGRFTRVLDVNYPFHSAALDPALAGISGICEGIESQAPRIPLYSSVLGRLATLADFAPDYWRRNLRDTVHFGPAIARMAAAGCNVFVEFSPHPALRFSIKQVLESMKAEGSVVETLHRDGDEAADLRRTAAELYTHGCDPDWKALAPAGGNPAALPSYPWERESYWIEEQSIAATGGKGLDPLLERCLRPLSEGGAYWETEISLERFPWLADHCVQGRPVFPAAAFLLCALKAAGELTPGVSLKDIGLHEALFLPEEGSVAIQVRLQPEPDGGLRLAFHAGDVANPALAREHMTGRVVPAAGSGAAVDLLAITEDAPRLHVDALYAAMHRSQLDYGPAFRGIQVLMRGGGEALARLVVPEQIEQEAPLYGLHPATLDACIQLLVTLTPGWPADLWMPCAVREFSLYEYPDPGADLLARARLDETPDTTAREISGDVFLVDQSGKVMLALRGLRVKRVSRDHAPAEWFHEVRWHSQALPPAPAIEELASCMAAGNRTGEEEGAIRAAMAEIDRLGAANIRRTFAELGFDFTPGRRFTADEAAATLGVIPAQRRLFGRLLQIMAEEKMLQTEGEAWCVGSGTPPDDVAARLRGPSPLPAAMEPLWNLFVRASLNLGAALTGNVNAVEILFGGEGAAMLEKLYASHPFWIAPMRQLAAAAGAIAGRSSGRLRILEIGGGTGGLTSHLLPLLPADRTEYVFTDVGSSFLARAQERFAAWPFLTDKLFDAEREPVAQGFEAGSFDIIVAANCLHTTRDIRQALRHAGTLLAPGGWLLLQEECLPERWTDLIFGLSDGWWRFADTDLRPAHPLLSRDIWRSVLHAEGFEELEIKGGSAADPCGSSVIVARKEVADLEPWLLLADAGGVAEQLKAALEELGQSCSLASGDALEAGRGGDGITGRVVDLRALDGELNESDDANELSLIHERLISDFLRLVHTAGEAAVAPRVVLVFRGSQATAREAAPINPAQASLWTAARVAALENPQIRITRIDLEKAAVEPQIAMLAAELLRRDREPEIAFRNGERLAPRLQQLSLLPEEAFAINLARIGSLEGIETAPACARPPGPGEVQIRVAAAGVNFRDLMNVLGAVDPIPLGLECSGVITAVGEGVREFSSGAEVMATALGTWRTSVNVAAALVATKPAQMSHEQAAAQPLAYLTAHYALRCVASLCSGKRVLIHSAAGGVGLAAVHVALAAGAEVFGTAGSAAKREYLRSLGVRHVFDSRSLEFAAEIRAMGKPLDVVLNCFTGDFIPASLDLLGEEGDFIEIGKRGVWTAQQIGARKPGVRYRIVDLATTMRDAPETLQPMIRQVAAELAAGTLPPVPIHVFPMSRATDALSHMQQARHTGKLVLKGPMRSGRMDGSWLITGGLGGLGIAVTEWLVERGARNLILIGRQPPREAALAAIERCKMRGCRVLVKVRDVSDEAAMAHALKRCAAELPALRGVFHMAGTLDDAPVRDLDWQRFAGVYAAKVRGAWNLHRLTRHMPIEHFVLFSSWTALLGSPGQAAHASASAFLDALAHYRRAQGLPAQAINWGGWRETGSAARPERLAHLARQGAGAMSTREALDALEQVMGSDAIQAGVSPFNAAEWRATSGTGAAGLVTGALNGRTPEPVETAGTPLPLREALQGAAAGPERRQVLEACIQRRLARVLRTPMGNFDSHKAFKHLGLDSLGSLEIRNLLEMDAGLKLPASLVYNHATIHTLATEIAGRMGVPLDEDHTGSEPGDDELAALLGALQDLPADEALRLLATDTKGGDR